MFELLQRRRSIRRFKKVEIDKEKMNVLIKAVLLAPSSRNLRPWEFIIVNDKEALDQLSKAKEHGAGFLKDAALGVVVLADPEKCDVWIEDTSIASIIIQLTAEILGLGSCWIQIRERKYNQEKTSEQYIRELLDIPEKIKVESIIAIGYPDEKREPYDEEDLEFHKILLNKYSSPYR